MTQKEIFVVIILGLVGYWATAAVIRHFKPKVHDMPENRPHDSGQRTEPWKSAAQELAEEEPPKLSEPGVPWSTVLGIAGDSSPDEIREAYQRQISLYHPDKVASLGPEFNEIALQKTKEINAAYDEAMRSRG